MRWCPPADSVSRSTGATSGLVGGLHRPLSRQRRSQLEAMNLALGGFKPSFSVQGGFPSPHVPSLEFSGACQSRTTPPDLWYQPPLADLGLRGRDVPKCTPGGLKEGL